MKALARLTCALLLAAATAAWADVSRDDAAAIAQRVSNGRVLAVERSDAGGRPVWRVKVVTASGDVRVILVDVASGRTY
jgi:uncharacterized membrane protein YkoI